MSVTGLEGAADAWMHGSLVSIKCQLPPNELGGLSLKVSSVLKKVLRGDGPFDVGPCSDVDRRDVVGVASVATAGTPEQISLRSVLPIFYPTGGADVACTPRVGRDDLDSRELGLVFNELPELVESPRMQAATLRPTSRDPSTDSFEVFKGCPSLGAFGLSHYLLGDDMVYIPLEPGLFSR